MALTSQKQKAGFPLTLKLDSKELPKESWVKSSSSIFSILFIKDSKLEIYIEIIFLSKKNFIQIFSKIVLKSKQRVDMEAIHLRQNLIDSIATLPADMLEELYKFISFLEYKKLSISDDSKEEILKNFKTSLQEMQMIKEGKLQARSADEFLDEL